MNRLRISVCLACVLLPVSLHAQVVTVGNTQGTAELQQALVALSGKAAISDVTLAGTVTRTIGPDEEAGTATLQGLAIGASKVVLVFPSGTRTDILNPSAAWPTGSWSDSDGVSHDLPFHDLQTEPSWFFPAIAISRAASPANGLLATAQGQVIKNSETVNDVTVYKNTATAFSVSLAPLVQHLSQIDYYLDSTTFLPASMTFTVHPLNDAATDLPIEIDFSSYSVVQGVQVPMHIQEYINYNLYLDLQIQSVTLNAGLTVTSFSDR